MQQLESRHKSELANHFRAQEKELEQLRITYERELERLRSKHRTELEQRVCVVGGRAFLGFLVLAVEKSKRVCYSF